MDGGFIVVPLLQELDKLYYFIKRDATSFSTYKTNILLSILSALFGALSYAFLGANASMPIVEQDLGMPFETYLIIGLAFNTYLSQSLTLVQRTINPWTLEEVLVSPTGISTFILGSSLWGFIWSTVVIAIYLSVGVFAFGIVLSINIIGTLIVIALGIGTFIGFSMIGAGVLILTKQGDPVTTLITIATNLFGNVLFPIQVMPLPLQIISFFVPQYYFFTSIRPMLTGLPIQTVLPELLILTIMCAVILPLGYLAYSWCLKTARKKGTLSWF